MPRTIERRTATPRPTGIDAKTQQYLALGLEEKAIKARREQLKKELGGVVDSTGEADEKGSLFLPLTTPLVIGDKTYTHLKRERRNSPVFLEEDAEKWLRENDLYERATETIVRLDQDAIYVLNQEEKIPDAVLDSWFEDKITWAFVPVTE